MAPINAAASPPLVAGALPFRDFGGLRLVGGRQSSQGPYQGIAASMVLDRTLGLGPHELTNGPEDC